MLFSQQTFVNYFSFSYTLLLVLWNNLNYVFTWKKITIFLFIDILGTKCQSAVWGQQVHLLLSQVRCPGTVPGSASCLKWQLPCPQDWNGHGHRDIGMPLWTQPSPCGIKRPHHPSACNSQPQLWPLWYGQKSRFTLLRQGWPSSIPQAAHSVCALYHPLSLLSAILTTPLVFCSFFLNKQQPFYFPSFVTSIAK